MPNERPISTFIAGLARPVTAKASDRRVWSMPLGSVILPYFLATNTLGQTAFSPEGLGAPLRLARKKDGTIRLNDKGLVVMRVNKEIQDGVRFMRERITASLITLTTQVQETRPDEYAAQVEAAHKAGAPIMAADQNAADDYLAQLALEAEAKAKAEANADKVLVPAYA